MFADGTPLKLPRPREGTGENAVEGKIKREEGAASAGGNGDFDKKIGEGVENDAKGDDLIEAADLKHNIKGYDSNQAVKNVEQALINAFEFLGPKVTREELREALGLTSFSRTLLHKFQLTPGEILQIADHAFPQFA